MTSCKISVASFRNARIIISFSPRRRIHNKRPKPQRHQTSRHTCKNNHTVIQRRIIIFFCSFFPRHTVIKTRSSRRRSLWLCLLLPPIIISPPSSHAVNSLVFFFPAQVQNRKICPLCVAAPKNCSRPIGKTPAKKLSHQLFFWEKCRRCWFLFFLRT